MPGTLQVLNIRYHLSHFQKSEKTWPRITKREMKATHLELGCFLLPLGKEAESRQDRARKRHDERKTGNPSLFGIFCENYKKVPLTDVAPHTPW